MGHKHEHDASIVDFFVAQHNSDQTEGRGRMIDAGAYLDLNDAIRKVKGQAVMGCGDGDIVHRTYYTCKSCPEVVREDKTIYHGDDYFKKNIAGTGRYADIMPDGWHIDYSEVAQDPEYKEYVRLREKFGQ